MTLEELNEICDRVLNPLTVIKGNLYLGKLTDEITEYEIDRIVKFVNELKEKFDFTKTDQ